MSTQHHRDYHKNYAQYWETCGEGFAHIKPGKWERVGTAESVAKSFERRYGVKDATSIFKDSVIIDYGIGNGRLAIPFLAAGAKRYVGIDIAQRQLDRAKEFLTSQGCTEGYDLLKSPVQFCDVDPDVFVSQACIQHFPSEKYLIDWCGNINTSGAKFLFLQYRHAKKNREFNAHSPIWACKVRPEYLTKLLSSYKVDHISNVEPNGYQNTFWLKK